MIEPYQVYIAMRRTYNRIYSLPGQVTVQHAFYLGTLLDLMRNYEEALKSNTEGVWAERFVSELTARMIADR